jgi:hypothetical protein
MWILRLVRNFALLAVLALAAHGAPGADKHGNPHCGGPCNAFIPSSCPKACACVAAGQSDRCVPKRQGLDTGKTQLGQLHPMTTPTRRALLVAQGVALE